MSQGILVNVFEHSHQYFSLGIRLYFGTIPSEKLGENSGSQTVN